MAPAVLRKFVRSLISGSIAQFFIVVVPFARQAARIEFSVAPTDIFENLISEPTNPSRAFALTYPFLIFILTPNFDIAFKCISIGLTPMLQPPGLLTFAFLFYANKGPRTKIPALIVLTRE